MNTNMSEPVKIVCGRCGTDITNQEVSIDEDSRGRLNVAFECWCCTNNAVFPAEPTPRVMARMFEDDPHHTGLLVAKLKRDLQEKETQE